MRQFTKDSQRVASLTGEELAAARSGRRLTIVDQKPTEGSIPQGGKDLTYALTAVDAENRSSPLSQFAAIRVMPPPEPPLNLKAELSEKSIRLSWEAPQPQAGGEATLYNVYRSEGEGPYPDNPRNDHPLTTLFFEETSFTFGTHYSYVVRSVLVSGASSRESVDSSALEVDPRDVYAPAAPTGLAVSAEGGVMKLFWFPNDETDLAEYKVYRSESETGEFAEMGTVAPSESSYVDQAVKPGVRYYYCLTAVDNAEPPNESSRSDVRGDRIPPVTPSAPKGKPRKP
jgi:fibronectin type 3 domain-containing protein